MGQDTVAALAQLQDVPIRPLFNPETAPLRGMNSFAHPSAVPPGFAVLLQNLRISDGSASLRNGTAEILQTGTTGLRTAGLLGVSPSAGIFRGATYWNGAFYAAYKTGTNASGIPVVDIFRSTDLLAWVQITSSTKGIQGTDTTGDQTTTGHDNRLVDSGDFCCYLPATAPGYIDDGFGSGNLTRGKELLLVSNGNYSTLAKTAYPRVLNGRVPATPETYGSLSRVAIHQPVAPPTVGDSSSTYVSLAQYGTIRNPADLTFAVATQFPSTHSMLLCESQGLNPNGYFRLRTTVGTATITGATNANPIVITAVAHGLTTGFWVTIAGVTGNTAANGSWLVTVINANTFSIAVAGNGAYAGGGTVTWNTISGDSCGVKIASLLSVQACKQLVFVTETTDANFWDEIEIELGDSVGNTYVKVYDGTDPTFERVEVEFGGSAAEPSNLVYLQDALSGFFPRRPTAKRASGKLSLVAIPLRVGAGSTTALPNNTDSIRFTWKGSTVTSATTMNFLVCGGSGEWRGLAQHGITFLNDIAQSESPGVILPLGGGDRISNLGGPLNENTRIPDSPNVFYSVLFPAQLPTSTEKSRGVTHQVVYRKEWGSNDFCAVNYGAYSVTTNTGAGIPAYTYVYGTGPWPGTPSGGEIGYLGLTWNLGLNLTKLMPDSFNAPIQPFSTAAAGSGRLFAGNGNKIQVSEFRNMFRHREAVRFIDGIPDVTSASERTFDGETVRSISAVAASLFGANQAFAFTDKGAYSLDGGDPRSSASMVGPIGTVARDSLAQFKGSMWFLDDQRQIRAFENGQVADPSRMVVEDYFQSPALIWDGTTTRGIPQSRLNRVCSIWHRDRLYVAITPYGGSYNTVVMVYDARHDAWFVDSVASGFSCEQWALYADASTGRTRLIAFGDAGRIFEYECPGQATDFGTDIPMAYHFPELHDAMWAPVRSKRLGVVCDDQDGKTLTTASIFRAGTPDASGSIDIDTASGSVWRFTDVTGGRGVGVRHQISGSVRAPWRLYSAICEFESAGGQGAGV